VLLEAFFKNQSIDMAAELANAVKRYIAGQGSKKSTYLFQTSRGMPLSQRNVLHDSLHPILKRMGREKRGFHIFRRYRASWLRKGRVPWDLEKMWMGHAHTRTSRTSMPNSYARREIPPQMVRKDWPWFRSTHQCFATFATKARSDRFKESSMKLLNLWSGRVDLNHRPPGPEPVDKIT
jgi:DNA-binding transcriptional regulator YdaS (Cro superfamily)